MAIAEEIRKRIEKKQKRFDEIMEQMRALDMEAREVEASLQAYQDTFKLLPKEEQDSVGTPEITMRAGSLVAQARDVLRKHGKAMHVNDLLRAMGKEPNKKDRLSLSGSLALYVRKEQVFNRPAPNVFGLIEWNANKEGSPAASPESNLQVQGVDRIPIRPITHRTN